MILAWVISLLLLCSSLISYIENLGALRIIEVNAMSESQKKFIAAEKAVQECQENLTALSQEQSSLCLYSQPEIIAGSYPARKNQAYRLVLWLMKKQLLLLV